MYRPIFYITLKINNTLWSINFFCYSVGNIALAFKASAKANWNSSKSIRVNVLQVRCLDSLFFQNTTKKRDFVLRTKFIVTVQLIPELFFFFWGGEELMKILKWNLWVHENKKSNRK